MEKLIKQQLHTLSTSPLLYRDSIYNAIELPEITINRGNKIDKWVPTKFHVKNPEIAAVLGEFIYPNEYCKFTIASTGNTPWEPVKQLKLKLLPLEIALENYATEHINYCGYTIYQDVFDGEDGEFSTYENWYDVYASDYVQMEIDAIRDEFTTDYNRYKNLFTTTKETITL